MDKEKQNKILQSQGIRLVAPDPVLKPTSKLVDPLSSGVTTTQRIELRKVPDRKPELTPLVQKEVQKQDKIEPKVKRNWKPLGKTILLLVILSVVGSAGWWVKNNFEISEIFSPNKSTSNQVIEEVGKLMELPKSEDPTVMTVTDLAPLEGQEFFKDAKVGDKVLVYSISKKAILYRPSERRVILTAVIN